MPRPPAHARRFLDTRHAFGGGRRDARGIPINESTRAAEGIVDADTLRPRVIARDAEGRPFEIEVEVVVGSDGSRGVVQRTYFRCDPDTDTAAFSEEQLWDELQKRVPGAELKRGPIFQRDVLRFRSFVALELRRGRVALVGDAAYTVPPPAAPGPDATASDRRRQVGELRAVAESAHGRAYLAEACCGRPFDDRTVRARPLARAPQLVSSRDVGNGLGTTG